MAEIFEIADSVTVMRDGKKVGECPIGETNEEKLVEQMVGEPVKDFYAETERHISDEVVLKVEDFTPLGIFPSCKFRTS